MVKATFLKEVPLFFGFTDKECGEVLRSAKEKCFPAGKVIFKEGAKGDALYIIVSGSVAIEKQAILPTTGALSTLILKSGDFFGELALFDKGSRTSTARTLEKTTVIVLMEKDFERLLNKTSLALKFMKNIIQIIATRIRHVNQELMVFYEMGKLFSQSCSPDTLFNDALTVIALSLNARRGVLLLKNNITGALDEKARYGYKEGAAVTVDLDTALRVLQEGKPFLGEGKEPLLLVPFGPSEARNGLLAFSGRKTKGKVKSLFNPDEVNMVSAAARLLETALKNMEYQIEEQSRQRLKRKYITF